MFGDPTIRYSIKQALLIVTLLTLWPLQIFAYEVISVENGGVLEGTIKFKGEVPVNHSHMVVNNPDFCGASVLDETYLVDPTHHGIKNVVISIEGITRGKKESTSTIMIENKKCHFAPHMMTGMAGDSYEIRNEDPVLHNTHLYVEETSILNVAMPSGGKNIRRSIGQPAIIKVKCDAHKFMLGWVFVSDSPYLAITNDEGSYQISEIPEGTYKVRIWHEGFPSKEKEVTILKGKKTELSLDLN
jgi:plastocyanin